MAINIDKSGNEAGADGNDDGVNFQFWLTALDSALWSIVMLSRLSEDLRRSGRRRDAARDTTWHMTTEHLLRHSLRGNKKRSSFPAPRWAPL